MVRLRNKRIGDQNYYYLEHSYRVGGKVLKKETYIGKVVPKDIGRINRDFVLNIYRSKWFDFFDKIRDNFLKEKEKIPEEIRNKELESFSIRFTYDTNRIEGSKLTLKDTADLLQRKITPKNRPLSDTKEAEIHRDVFYEMLEYKKDLSLQIILLWHKKLFDSTKPEIAGRIRDYQVAISGSKFMPPAPFEVNLLLFELFRWYTKVKIKLNPVELAALTHLKLVTIHPFGDGNGRIGRLAMNFVLHKHDFPMFNIRYEKRTSYYTALERSQIKNDESIFLQWFFRRYLEDNRRYLK